MEIRLATKADLGPLLTLYQDMKGEAPPRVDGAVRALWNEILADPNHYILLGVCGDALVSSCTLMIVKNLTHGQRPFALVENVVTATADRGQGYGSALLNRAGAIAKERGCYKIMLLTGSKLASTLNFYRRAGYNDEDKTGFIQWL